MSLRWPVVLLLLLATARSSPSQTLGLDPLTGEVGLGLRGEWADQSEWGTSDYQTLFGGFSLRSAGFIVDPRLIGFGFSLAPLLSRSWYTISPVGSSSEEDSKLGSLYGTAGMHFLPLGPLGLDLTWSRRRYDLRDRTGRERDHDLTVYGAALKIRPRLLPGTFYVRRELDHQTWHTPQLVPLYDHKRTRVGLSARNSKTNLFIENLSTTDQLSGREANYLVSRLYNRQRWGKGSQLTSDLAYTSRERGMAGETLFRLVERARLQHTHDVSSRYHFMLGHQTRGSSSTKTIFGEIGARYQATQPLALTIAGRIQKRTFGLSDATQLTRRVLPGANLFVGSPSGFTARLAGEAGYQWGDLQGGDGAVGTVVDERHNVGEDLIITLTEDHAVTSTIRVRSIDGSVLFVSEVDYTTSSIGPRTQIIVLPGGRIQQDSEVAVDYQYTVVAELSFDGPVVNLTANLGYRWLSLYHNRFYQGNAESLTSQPSSIQPANDFMVTGVSASTRGSIGTASLRLEHVVTDRLYVRSSGLNASLSISTFLMPRLTGAIDAAWSSSRADESDMALLRGQARLIWTPGLALRLTARVIGYGSEFDERKQSRVGGGIEAEYRWRAMRVTLRAERVLLDDTNWWYENRMESRVWAGVSREF